MAKRKDRKSKKGKKKLRHSDQKVLELVKAFDEALAHVSEMRPAIDEARHNPRRLIDVLDQAFRPYDEALELYAVTKRGGWSRANVDDLEGAYERVSLALEGLLELERTNARLVEGKTVLIDDGGVYLQKDYERVPRRRRKEETCCFTRIEFENLLGADIRVTASDDDGQIESAEFKGGETKPLTARDGRNRIIPGGLGRCVTIEVRVKRFDGSFAEPHTWELCCDQEGVGPGFELTRTFVHSPTHSSSITPLRITALEVLTPCPETAAAGGSSPHGTPSSGIRSIPGLRVDDRVYHYGSDCRMRFVPRPGGCRNIAFVQGVKRKVEIQRPGQPAPQPAGGLSTDDRFHLDVPSGQNTPGYPHTRDLPGGGKEMRDAPGVENPWGRFDLDGKRIRRLPVGTILITTWTFRTWVVCLDGPVRVLGYFDWSVKLTLTIGRDHRDTTGEVEMERPRWSNSRDLDTYKRVVREARDHRGFLPPN